MIEEQGRVVTVEEGAVWVETIRKTTCSSCSARNGCGQHLAEKYKSSKTHSYIRAANETGSTIKEHDEVVIGIPEDSLMKASMVVYLLPRVKYDGRLVAWQFSGSGRPGYRTAGAVRSGSGFCACANAWAESQ
ncbi:SoxR reducing system RseC family protein [Endozoicomonas lisbonensis]|uniref:SoxR reducing system RseC family protein n=1 Tax=Endozoicomonas lisbonensis TaxID=3120522 RepID=UPI003399C78F